MPDQDQIPVTIQLDPASVETLDRLRGELPRSAFIQLLLKIAGSGAVTPPGVINQPKDKSS